ncbi:tetratricopeptide repeat protein [Dokdonia sp.]|uniref:tetratricopeptide repeat protein n=1 Tax=Dokdonia sp. TaxID=2024995 RepID=UPI00326458C8
MNKNPDHTSEVLQLLETAYEQRGVNMHYSIQLAQSALEKSRALNNASLIGKSLSRLALFHMISAENQIAIEMSEEAIEHFRKDNDELGIANAKYNIAGVYYKTNNYHLGMFHLIDCLTIFRKHNDKHNESRTQKTLGTIYEVLGDQLNAIKAYESAIQCAIDVKDRNLESNVYNPLSGIFLKQGKIKKALDIIELSVAIKKETGDRRGYAFAIYGRGKVYTQLEKYEEARSDFNEALEIHEDVGDLFAIAMCHNKMAKLFIKTGEREMAKKCLSAAIDISTANNLSIMKYKCYYFMYSIYKEEGESVIALQYLEDYLKEKDAALNSQTLKVIENYERISKIQSKENEVKLKRQKAEIIAKQERAEQEASMKQNFLSAMSHEIRTPLNAVTSIISLLEDRSDESEKKLLTSLRFSSKNLLRIINDILDFSKLESNKMILEKHPVKFKEILQNIKQTYIGLADEKGIVLNLSIGTTVADSYNIDETKLFQILGNLVSNAIKFTEEGSVDIIIDLVTTHKEIDTISFNIKDTGIGIPLKERERLFESFYMPQAITTRNDGGTGLGLAIVKKLIELHGSSISIESEEGKGSVFNFELEFEKAEAPEKSNTDMFKILQNKTAILAEDNEINALVMRQLLNKWGISIKRVKNGKQAIVQAQEIKVDFILMDIHMPEMNGYDATRIIRTTKNKNQHTPIFALTADITSANNEEYIGLFNGFLWKPIEIKRLFNVLTEIYTEKDISISQKNRN